MEALMRAASEVLEPEETGRGEAERGHQISSNLKKSKNNQKTATTVRVEDGIDSVLNLLGGGATTARPEQVILAAGLAAARKVRSNDKREEQDVQEAFEKAAESLFFSQRKQIYKNNNKKKTIKEDPPGERVVGPPPLELYQVTDRDMEAETMMMDASDIKGKEVMEFVTAPAPSLQELREVKTLRGKAALIVWYKRLGDLYLYKERNGDCNVPQKYEECPELGIWVNKQRMEQRAYENNKPTSMTETKIAALDSIGFEWGKRKGETAWNQKYRELAEYTRQHGNCLVPTKYYKNPALGRWISTQRQDYRKYQNGDPTTKMTAERIELLEALGFQWKMMMTTEEAIDGAGGNFNSIKNFKNHHQQEESDDEDDRKNRKPVTVASYGV